MAAENEDFERARQILLGLRDGTAMVPEASERDAKIVARYCSGEATLDEVGVEFGITRERVRQIINLRSNYTMSDIRWALGVEAVEKRRAQRLADAAAVAKWSEENLGESLTKAALDLGFEEAYVKKLLGARKKFHLVKARPKRQQFSDDELLAMLREFHEETGSTSGDLFTEWSTKRGGPTRQTPALRFGKWSIALEKAGINDGRAVERERMFTDEDYWAAVVDFLRSDATSSSVKQYEAWNHDHKEYPSGAGIRARLGRSWVEIINAVMPLVTGNVSEVEDQAWAAEVLRERDWADMRAQDARKREVDPNALLKAAFAEIGEPLTSIRYDEWAREHGETLSVNLTHKTEKSWAQMLLDAGVSLTPRQKARAHTLDS